MPTATHPLPIELTPTKPSRELGRHLLLSCGIVYAVLYVVANDVIAASAYDHYSRLSQAISELSATGSPTRPFLTALLPVFNALLMAFGVGVWRSWGGRRALRATSVLLVAFGVVAFFWLAAPMSRREAIAAGQGTTSCSP